MKVTSLFRALAGAALLLPLAACGSSADEGKLTLVISEYGEGTKSLAEAAGIFDDADYDVEFAHFDTGSAMLAALASDNLDLASVGGLPPIVAAASGMDFTIIASGEPRNEGLGGDRLLVNPKAGITTPEELAGHKIGVPKGTSGHSHAMKVLANHGLDVDDVEFVYLEPAQLASALSSRKVDAASVYEPFATAVASSGGEVLVAGGNAEYPSPTFFATSDSNLADAERRAAVTDALERLDDLHEWAVEHPEEHAQAIAKDSGMDKSDAEGSRLSRQLVVVPVNEETIAVQQQTADLFRQVGEIKGDVDFASVVENLLG